MTRCSLPSVDRNSASLHVADDSAVSPHDHILARAAQLLVAYFDGRPVSFDLPLAFEDMTDFRTRVLISCAQIPWGETRSYGELAAAAGAPGAARAVGQALNRNPMPVVVPCHRVIGADGGLVGFGAGLDMKRRLLTLEEITIDR